MINIHNAKIGDTFNINGEYFVYIGRGDAWTDSTKKTYEFYPVSMYKQGHTCLSTHIKTLTENEVVDLGSPW